MKRLIFFCVMYLWGMSIAFSDDLDGGLDLTRRYARLGSLSNLQKRYIDSTANLRTRDLIFPRAQPPRRAGPSSPPSPGSPPGSPQRARGAREGERGPSPQAARGRAGIIDRLSQLRISREGGAGIMRATEQGARRSPSPSARTPSTINLAGTPSFGSPSRASSAGPYSLESLTEQHPQPQARAHAKMRGPGMMAIDSHGNPGQLQRVPSGQLTQYGGRSVDQIHGTSAPREGGSSTMHATGRRVEGYVEAASGTGTSILKTSGRSGGETKIALPGDRMHIDAAATNPGETVGVKIKSYGPGIAGVSGYNLPP